MTHIEVLNKNLNWLKNFSKTVATVGAIIILAIIPEEVLKCGNKAYPGKLKSRKRHGYNTEFNKAITFDLNDLLKHEQQQVSVAGRG